MAEVSRPPTPAGASRMRPAFVLPALAGIWLVLTFVVAGCTIEEPALPTFHTTLTLPIGEKRIDIDDIIADEEYLTAFADSTLAFTVTGDGDTITLDFSLGMDVAADTVEAEVGNFELTVPRPAAFNFTLGELYPLAILLDGTSVVVPAFNFDLEGGANDLAGIITATVAGGTLQITLSNGLPVPVSGPGLPEQIVVKLLDPGTSTTITSVAFPQAIAPGDSATASTDLTGVVLPDSVAIQLSGGSPGSTGLVLIDAAAYLDVAADVQGLRASDAIAVVDQQTFQGEYATDLPDTITVVAAEIVSGQLTFELTNGVDLPCDASLTWPEIQTPTGQTLVTQVSVPPTSTRTAAVDLSGHRIQAPGGTPLTEINLTLDVTTPGSGGLAVALSARDSLLATIQQAHIEFGAITGSLPEQVYAIDPLSQDVDLPEELAGISLTMASLMLEVNNGAEMPARLDVQLSGASESGSRVDLDVSADIPPATGGGRSVTTVVLDETNSNIVPFLNNLPTSLTLQGDVIVGGDDIIGTVRPGDSAAVRWHIESPLEVIIENSVLTTDPDELGLDADTQEIITDHAGGAQVATEITNHLPFSVEVRLLLSTDPSTIETEPQLIIGPLAVAGGQVDPIRHICVEPLISRPRIELDAVEAKLFGEAGLHTLVEVTLPGSHGEPVRLRSIDYLKFIGAVSLDVEVKE